MFSDLAAFIGTVDYLPSVDSFFRDGATHLLTTALGTVRLHAVDSEVLSNLNVIADGETPILVVGAYRVIRPLLIVVTNVARIGMSLDESSADNLIGRGGDGPDPLKYNPERDPGDAFPWGIEKLRYTLPRKSSTARFENAEGQLSLVIKGTEQISDICHHPVATATVDLSYAPHIVVVEVKMEKTSDVCTTVHIPHDEEWEVALYKRGDFLKHVQHVQIIHPSGPLELIEVLHS